jgi:hypothetical protein
MKLLLFALLTVAGSAVGQDFGYEYLSLSDFRALGISWNEQQFSPRSTNPLGDTARIAFSTSLPFIEFRQNTGRLAAGYQTFTDRNGTTRSSFSVYGESRSDFPLDDSKRGKGSWFIPVAVGANYVKAESPNALLEDFDIGSFGLGTGIVFKHFERSYGVQGVVVGSLYYASEGFSTDYGMQSSLSGDVTVILPGLLFEGVLLGYRYEWQQWNMNNAGLNYQRWYSGAVIAVMF